MNEPDFLEQLAEWDVPAPPREFDEQLHNRVNRSLTMLQLFDLAVRGMPWAMFHFGRALVGLVAFTLTGQLEDPRGRKSRPPR